jgi:hypothetical protein
MMVAETFSSLGNDSRDAVQKFFAWAPSHLNVKDPAGHSGDLSSYLTSLQRQKVLASFAAAESRARQANEAEASGNHQEAIRLWRVIFGDDFPTYG